MQIVELLLVARGQKLDHMPRVNLRKGMLARHGGRKGRATLAVFSRGWKAPRFHRGRKASPRDGGVSSTSLGRRKARSYIESNPSMDFCAEARIFKEHLALVERADAFWRRYYAGRFERAFQAGREYSFRTGRFEHADGGLRAPFLCQGKPALKSPHSCRTLNCIHAVVSVAQPVEHRSVEPRVVGSNPIAHPNISDICTDF